MNNWYKNCDIIKCKNDYTCTGEKNIKIPKDGNSNKIIKYENFESTPYCITLNDKQYY